MNTPWSVAIFASRESLEILSRTLIHFSRCAERSTATAELLINGNEVLSRGIADLLSEQDAIQIAVRIWSIPFGDKANAWNQYVHAIWDGTSIAFNMDGYVRLCPGALRTLATTIESDPSLLAATGIPIGRSSALKQARKQLSDRGLHGNLFCLRPSAMESLRAHNFRLPIGLYRTDATIGALIKFNMNPHSNEWDDRRISVVPASNWHVDPKVWWRVSDLTSQWKRMLRQAQGDLENRAVRHCFAIRRFGAGCLPETVQQLVRWWIEDAPEEAALYLRHPMRKLALYRMMKSFTRREAPELRPRLLATFQPSTTERA